MGGPAIGRSLPRKEARQKVTGRARYLDDLTLPGMLHGVTVRSAVPRGIIRDIDFEPGFPWHEFTIVTAEDVPGANCVALILEDQPYLASETVNHPEEPVVLLAHADRQLLEEARRRVKLVIEPLPPIFSIQEALDRQQIVWGDDNRFRSYTVSRGDVEAAFRDAHLIVEAEYETGAQEQLYIEPNGMLAVADAESGVTVWGSMQCPYYVHRALVRLFNLSSERVRVVQTETGGGFGGKEEYPSIVAGHAALLAWKSGRPVKIVYDRLEDMASTTKRHPSRTRHRTGIDAEGRLVGMDIEFVLDGGAYCTLSPVVLSRGTIHAAGPYFCPNVRVRSTAVATNAPPHGAFRGFGAPQAIFALERQMDRVAAAAGLTPDELRRRNFISTGQANAVGQVLRERIDMPHLVDRAFELSGYHHRRLQFDAENGSSPIKRGVGFSCFMHGAGFTGSGESHLASTVAVEAASDGHVRVLTSSTEIGQGTNTALAQIASEALGIGFDDIEVVQPDTSQVPDSGPTVASRTCMVVGKLVENAALALKQVLAGSGLLDAEYDAAAFREAAASYIARHGILRGSAHYEPPEGLHWDDEKYEGDAYGAYAWAVHVAQVAVDLTTFEIRVEDFVAVQEVGRVINPVLAMGQIEGGVAQAIGWTLYEDVVWREGRMANGQLTNYIIPTAMDVPPITVEFVEYPYSHGPGGAKGIGELPMDGPAPAILNAVQQATGVSLARLPVTPEVLADALAGGHV
jgi:CO/xanthine dehydrogenase Mo-binding subunit